MLNWSDATGFDKFRQAFEKPSSPGYRKRLTPDEVKARFGPSQEAYDSVLAWLLSKGFTLTEGSDNRLTLTVSGTRGQAERAFDVTIEDYLMGPHQFHAIDTDPSLPAALAPLVRSVSGFSNLAQPQPAITLTPQAIAQAYNGTLTLSGTLPGTGPSVLPPGINGAGQTIALLEWDSFNPSDVSYWLSQVGLPATLINQVPTVPVKGGTSPSGCKITVNGCGEGEVLLDIGAALGIAQGANVAVFVTPNSSFDMIGMTNAAVNYLNKGPGGGGVISNSWSVCEPQISNSENDSTDTLLQVIPIYGLSFFTAAGDNAGTCVSSKGTYANTVAYPANVPHAVAVGGTLPQPGASGNYGSESWWTGGGFGVSQHFGLPIWQNAFTTAAGRSVPDVSAEASPAAAIPVCQNTLCKGIGGTSLATPIWASVWALGSQAASLATGSVGGAEGANGGAFYNLAPYLHSPSTMTGPNNDFAHLGLGSPDITNVVSLLAGPPVISGINPASGPMTGGTTVTINGHAFIGVSRVLFGAVPASSFTVDAESQITAVSPAGGGTPITVQTPAGGVTTSAAKGFTYLPTITKVSPNSGPLTGLTPVTVTGLGFTKGGPAPFFFGGVAAVNAQCFSSTQCTMMSPAGAVGTVDVTFTGAASSSVSFTYAGPTITTVSPNAGAQVGGTAVNLVGTGLSQNMTVKFGNTVVGVFCPEPNGQNQSVTACTLSTPPGTGAVHVTVTVDGVTSPETAADTFTYEPLPFGTMSPSQGSYTGGTVVTVTGGNFKTAQGATQFSFNIFPKALAATNVECSSTKVCTMTTPPLGDNLGGSIIVSATANGLTGTIGEFFYIGVQQKGTSGKQPPCHGTCQ